jgi:hypothetical protein
MTFNTGDIIGHNGLTNRTVVYVDIGKQIYGLKFEKSEHISEWSFKDAHESYKLMPPKHIPKEQHEKYREMRNMGK